MTNKNKKDSDTSEDVNKEEEETAESDTEDTEESEQDEEADSTESEGDEEEESEHIDSEERDLDSEIEEEEKAGKGEDDTEAEDEDDDDKPVTRKELRAVEIRNLESTAFSIARGLAESDKEARLIVAKWKNRKFPKGMTLDKQIEEAYVITHGRNIIGQRNEALRALSNRRRVNNNPAGTHRDGPVNLSEPKLDAGERLALKQSGFLWNAKTKRFEKKVRGGVVVRNSKTKKAELIKK